MGFDDIYLTSKRNHESLHSSIAALKIDDIIEEPCVISTRLQ